MKKAVLDRFISKYNLGGVAEAVTLTVTKKGTSTKCMSDDKYVAANVSTTLLDLPVGVYHVFETAVLSKLLGVLSDEVKITRKDEDVVITLSDDNKTKVQFCLADESVIPAAPSKINEPEYDVVFNLTPTVMSTFVKAKSALPDVATFAVIADTKNAELVIGYDSDNNSNRVTVNAEVLSTAKIKPLFYSANYLSAIFSANKEATSGKLSASVAGLVKLEFAVEGFQIEYFLPNIDKE